MFRFMCDGSGRSTGLRTLDVWRQVTGYLMKQAYQEGASVKQGQLLVSD